MSNWRDLFATLSGSDNDDKIQPDLPGDGILSSKSSLSRPGSGEKEGFAGDAADWGDRFEERAAHRQHDGYRTRAEAERLAWAETENLWHLQHGERVAREWCAGCRGLIGGVPALDLIDGNRVHDRAGNDCLIRHGARWRAAATAALLSLGLTPPGGIER